MKKKLIIILTIIILIIMCVVGGIIFFVNKNKDVNNDYVEEDMHADTRCFYSDIIYDEEDSEEGYSLNYMYIYKDSNDLVNKVIYKTVYQSDYFTGPVKSLTQSVLDIYKDVDGISTSIDTVDGGYSVVTITYDYDKINLKQVKKELKDILDTSSVLYKIKEKVSVDDYLDLEDIQYNCY